MKYLKKKKQLLKKIISPVSSSKKSSFSTNLQVNSEIVNGICPHCRHDTVLVSLWTNSIYRCMTCGHDTEQKVNGKISYIPHVVDKDKFQYKIKTNINGQNT